jgi:hypothetical protein
MPTPAFNPVTADGQVSASELTRLAAVTESGDRVLGNRTVASRRNAGGVQLDAPLPLEMWARITGGGNPYTWERVLDSVPAAGGDLTWTKEDGGPVGTLDDHPAYEENQNPDVPDGTVVRLRLGGGDYYLFEHCCG